MFEIDGFISLWLFAICASAIIDCFIMENTFHWLRVIMWLFGPFTIIYLIIDFCNAVQAILDQAEDEEEQEQEENVVFWNKDKSSCFTIKFEDVGSILECLANKMQNCEQIDINDCIEHHSNTEFVVEQHYDMMVECLKEMEEKLFTIHMLEESDGHWVIDVVPEKEAVNRRSMENISDKEYEQRVRTYFGIKDNDNSKEKNN